MFHESVARQNVCLQNSSGIPYWWSGTCEACIGWRWPGDLVDHIWSCEMFEKLDKDSMSCVWYLNSLRSFQYHVVWCALRGWSNTNFVLGKKFHAVVVYSAQAYWNVVKKINENGDYSLPVVGCERTCLLHTGALVWIRWPIIIKSHHCYFDRSKYERITRFPRQWIMFDTKYDVIYSWWLSSCVLFTLSLLLLMVTS